MSRIDEMIQRLCPDGVEYRKLSEVGDYVKTKIPVDGVDADTYTGVDNLVKDKGGRVPAESIPSSGACTEVAAGDLLLGNIRPNLRKLWLADVDGGASNDVLVYRLKVDDIAPEFFYHVMADERFFEYNIRYMRGAKMPRGDKARILAYEIPVPPLDVQREV
ncbi:MAG TPA: restriction endonuclease subunit S, partial [Candidatus Aveggerthella excrementigallinarum]|nr:restriction endonuclease subunit S [Candidatus Aveggerthella excrementigallinarum]